MRLPPQYWAKKTRNARLPDGRSVPIAVWGWSDESEDEAAGHALERAAAFAESPELGKGPAAQYYPLIPVREPTLGVIGGSGWEPLAVVTRNRYGAEVLNTDALVIADVDLPEQAAPTGLFHRRKKVDEAREEAIRETRMSVERFREHHPDFGVRLYTTRNGFRVIVTGTNLLPGSGESTALLQELGSDPLYVRLCTAQTSYRARLTPKPWRIGLPAERWEWPLGPDDEGKQAQWAARYRSAGEPYAVCHLESAGGPQPSGDEQRVIDVHDTASRVDSDLPLA